MKILLIGPQGSGKSTQGKMLAEYLGIPYISTGDIFRNLAQDDRKIKQVLDAGQLVDDSTTIELIRKRIVSADCQNGFIMDGYPRTLEQALKLADMNFNKAFYLEVPREIILKRLLNRGRADDTEELIQRRLDLYYQQTEALLDYFSSQGILVKVDGTKDVQKVYDEIKKSLRA